MPPREHHPLGFSRWPRLSNCPFSMKAEQGLEDVSSEIAEVGTTIHEHLERHTDSDDHEEQEIIEASG